MKGPTTTPGRHDSVLSPEELDYAIVEAIPLHRLLGLRVVHDGDPPAVALPDRPDLRNHIGGVGGAAQFAVAEAASAALVFSRYASIAERFFAIPHDVHVTFRRPARGELVARATSEASPRDLLLALDTDAAATLPIAVEVVDGAGRVVLGLRVRWQLRPGREGHLPALPRQRGGRAGENT